MLYGSCSLVSSHDPVRSCFLCFLMMGIVMKIYPIHDVHLGHVNNGTLG